MLKIFILTDFVPDPATGGAPLRTFGHISHLCKRHEILLFAPRNLSRNPDIISRIEGLGIRLETAVKPRTTIMRKIGVRVKAFFSEIPSHWALSWDQEIADMVRSSALKFDPDLIIIDHLSMCRFLESVQIGKPVVLNNHNVESILEAERVKCDPCTPAGLVRRRESRKVPAYETAIMTKVALTIAVSDVDKKILENMCVQARVATVENGIELCESPSNPRPCGKTALFAGTLGYKPNVEAAQLIADEILPEVRKAIPDFVVKIVGRRPPTQVLRLARPGLEIIPDVPDMKPYVDEAGIIIVPLRSGSGTRLKILEAMAGGKCVVSTSKGAEGLDVTDGVDILLRDDMREFAAAVVDMLEKPERAEEIGRNARCTAIDKYSNEQLALKMENYLLSVVEARQPV